MECGIKYATENGFLLGINANVKSSTYKIEENVLLTTSYLHNRLGHPGMESVKRTSKDISINLTETTRYINPCEDYEL